MWRSAAALALAAVLANGCAVVEQLERGGATDQPSPAPPSRAPTASATPADAQVLLAYAESFTGLPSDMRRDELARAASRHAEEQSLNAAVRYALLLILSDAAPAEFIAVKQSLQERLEQHRGGQGKEGLAPLAAFLLQVLETRMQLLRKNTELQEKLDQLKAIEQKLREREEPDSLPTKE